MFRPRPPLLLVALPLAWPLLLSRQVPAPPAPGTAPVVVPFRASGIYARGEKAGWTVSAPEPVAGSDASGTVRATRFPYALKRNNQEVIASGELDLSNGPVKVETTAKDAQMLFLTITPAPVAGTGPRVRPLNYGAVIDPTGLRPVVAKPKDFDAFWKRKIAELKRVPENAVVTPGTSPREDVEYSLIRMDHVNGTHVYGQMARPKKPGKYPAILQLQWASPPYPLDPWWIVGRAAQGFLVLNIEPHDVLPTEPPAYYASLPDRLKNYGSTGQEDREQSAFVEMYLRDYRAAEYLSHRPDWDGRVLIATGTSMGGQQSLVVAGLHPKITHVIVNEPAGADLSAPLHGRSIGYPFFPTDNPKVMETARYVDAINFADRIKATSLVGMGFVDDVAPPAGIWTAYNLIKGPKEAAPMVDSPHNNSATPEQQRPILSRSEEWFAALARGERVMPRGVPGS